MRRLATILAAVVAATLLSAAPAWSVARTAPAPALVSATAEREVYVVPCVTTSWRSAYWGLAKTRPGSACYATPDMWVPRSWQRVGTASLGGHRYPVFVRR